MFLFNSKIELNAFIQIINCVVIDLNVSFKNYINNYENSFLTNIIRFGVDYEYFENRNERYLDFIEDLYLGSNDIFNEQSLKQIFCSEYLVSF